MDLTLSIACDREIPWEEYRIQIEMQSGQTERERNKIEALTKSHLSKFLIDLVVFADSHRSHTPPITSNDVLPFPWRVSFVQQQQQQQSR